jgi:hypothetical protein
MAEALRGRPSGWHARGAAEPPEVAAHAWGRLGEQLGRELEQRISARAGARANGGGGTAGVPEPQGVAGGGR